MYQGLYTFETRDQCLESLEKSNPCAGIKCPGVSWNGTSCVCPELPEQPSVKTYDVNIQNFSFIKSPLTIRKGESVRWINKEYVVHTVTSDSGSELDSGTLDSREEYTHVFNISGSYEYHCNFHQSMRGKVVVE